MTGLDRLKKTQTSTISRLYEVSAGLTDIVNLAPGEPDFVTPPHILAAMKKALDAGDTHYAPYSGLLDFRKAIATHYKEFFGVDANENQVLVTHGSNQGIFLVINNLLDPGDEVIVLAPAWFGYGPMIRYSQGIAKEVPLRRDDWGIDQDELERRVSPRTKLIIACSPNNPTGSLLNSRDLEKIVAVAAEHKLTVISDEIYNRIVYDDGSFRSLGTFEEIKDRVIVVNGFSKSYAMTGIRLGYVIGPVELIKELGKVQGFSSVCVSPSVQRGGITALTGPQDCVDSMVNEYDKRRRWLVQELNSIEGLSCDPPGGAFYVFPRIPMKSSEEFATRLIKEQHVITVPGTAFGSQGEGYLRISYATSHEVLSKGVDRIRRMIGNPS